MTQTTPSRWLLPALVSFALTIAILVPRLGAGPLGGTEAHRALAAHQMLKSGDWLIPQLYGRLYLRKPPLHYWFAAAIEALAGHGDEFIWRLPSALSTALLAAVAAAASARWFGSLAAWVGGLSLPCLVTLWAQGRTGEIDSLDMLLTVSALFVMIDLAFTESPKAHGSAVGLPPWRSAILAGLLFGGALLTKGPVCLILIGGLLIWTIACRRHPLYSARPGTWPRWIAALAIGLVMFFAYALAVKLVLAARHTPPDMTGVNEIMENAYPTSLRRLGEALALPFIVLIYALPFSAALIVAMTHAPRDPTANPSRRIIYALAIPILISFLFGMVTGMHLERYQFIVLPLLCPLAGASAVLIHNFSIREKQQMRVALIASIVGYAIGTAILTTAFWHDPAQINRPALILCNGLAAATAVIGIILLIRRRWWGASVIPILALLLSVPFATYLTKDRRERSGFRGAALLGKTLPPGTPVIVGGMLGYEPELFYYSGLAAHAYAEKMPPPDVIAGNQWLILDEEEFRQYKQLAPQRLAWVKRFEPGSATAGATRNPGFIVWFLPPTTTAPSTIP